MRLLILAAVIWGSSFPVIKYALRDISPMLFVVLRFAVAFLVVTAVWRRRMTHLFNRQVFLLSLPNALSFILQYRAQELTTASKTALFVNSTPVFTVLLAFIFLKDPLRRRQIGATVLAMIGVVVTSTGLELSSFSAINIGDVLAVGTGFCWAVFIVSSSSIVKRVGPWELAQGLYFWTVVLTLPLVFVETPRFAWSALPAILYLAAFATALGYYLYLRGVRDVGPVSTSIIILIEVVVAFGISNVFLGETFSAVEAAGVAMVVGGVVLVARR